ncbi:MAG: hypothetical protein ABJE95_02135 [Byssovorax sp.]
MGDDLEGPAAHEADPITQAGIQYHNGPVMLGTVGIYYIWYGNWQGTGKSILKDFASSLGGSPWWNINTSYTDGNGKKLSSSASYLGGYQYTGSSGYNTYLTDAQIQSVVSDTINQGKLPKSSNAVYLLLTSKDVDTESFNGGSCGFHTGQWIGGTQVKYGWVGDASMLHANDCSGQATSPNGNRGADGMTSHVAHELTEAATDPWSGGWYSANGDENGDKCSWTFGKTSKTQTGADYNITLGARKYLIQQNWVNAAGGYCAMSYGPANGGDQCPNDPNKTAPGKCGCGKVDPVDVAGYHDAQGYLCSDWVNYDCTQAAEQYGYTATQESNLIKNCGISCKAPCP